MGCWGRGAVRRHPRWAEGGACHRDGLGRLTWRKGGLQRQAQCMTRGSAVGLTCESDAYGQTR